MTTTRQRLDQVIARHEAIRQESMRTLEQLPSVSYSWFCKLPPNRKEVNCSIQKELKLIKKMEELREEEYKIIQEFNRLRDKLRWEK